MEAQGALDHKDIVSLTFGVKCFHRERQEADGQMKELQDQLEAEQYFSVSSRHVYYKCTMFV